MHRLYCVIGKSLEIMPGCAIAHTQSPFLDPAGRFIVVVLPVPDNLGQTKLALLGSERKGARDVWMQPTRNRRFLSEAANKQPPFAKP